MAAIIWRVTALFSARYVPRVNKNLKVRQGCCRHQASGWGQTQRQRQRMWGQKDELLLRPRYAVLCEVRVERYKNLKVRQGCYRHQATGWGQTQRQRQRMRDRKMSYCWDHDMLFSARYVSRDIKKWRSGKVAIVTKRQHEDKHRHKREDVGTEIRVIAETTICCSLRGTCREI